MKFFCYCPGHNAHKFIELAKSYDKVMTCNSGIEQVMWCDYYYQTCVADKMKALVWRAKAEMKLAELIDERAGDGRASGVQMLEWAIQKGATQISMVGYSGWRSDEMEYCVNGKTYFRHGLNEDCAEQIHRIVSVHQDVHFTWYGETVIDDRWHFRYQNIDRILTI